MNLQRLEYFVAVVEAGSVSRASVIFYSMPVWFALMAHVALPGERITRLRGIGLIGGGATHVVRVAAGADAARTESPDRKSVV